MTQSATVEAEIRWEPCIYQPIRENSALEWCHLSVWHLSPYACSPAQIIIQTHWICISSFIRVYVSREIQVVLATVTFVVGISCRKCWVFEENELRSPYLGWALYTVEGRKNTQESIMVGEKYLDLMEVSSGLITELLISGWGLVDSYTSQKIWTPTSNQWELSGYYLFPLVKCTTVKDPQGKSDKGALVYAAGTEKMASFLSEPLLLSSTES